jgi:hypothetical protein
MDRDNGHELNPGAALERRLKRLGLTGQENEWTDRYLTCGHVVDPQLARPRERFEAVARFIRDLLSHRWVKTRRSRIVRFRRILTRRFCRRCDGQCCRGVPHPGALP